MTESLRLYLLRHAKSSWKTGEPDFERPLNKRGGRDAEAIAEFIGSVAHRPALILCSAARRARETLQPLVARLDGEAQVVITRLVYEADAEALLDLIRRSGSVPSLMVIGHNPTIEDLTGRLAASSEAQAAARLQGGFPPGGLATLAFDAGEWRDVVSGTGRLIDFRAPERA
jgi:phosphohistidine phosphatase